MKGWIPNRGLQELFICDHVVLGIVVHNTSALLNLSKTKLSLHVIASLWLFRYFFFFCKKMIVFYLRDEMTASQEESLCVRGWDCWARTRGEVQEERRHTTSPFDFKTYVIQ